MGDSGVRMRGLPGTSAAVACGLVASGQAGALVSAGSTGGIVATAVATLGCAPGVLRPAIAVLLPTAGRGTVLLDAGATADPTPEMLAQFAMLGTGYARAVLGLQSPSVGLLTIGSEPGKGNRLARRAQPLLCSAPVRFTGNVEGRDVLGGAVDVVVTDGFTGNVALKLIEGSLRLAVTQTRAALTAGPAGAVAQFANRAGCAAWPNGLTPTPAAGRCCSAWVAASSSRTARPGPGPSPGLPAGPRRGPVRDHRAGRPGGRRLAGQRPVMNRPQGEPPQGGRPVLRRAAVNRSVVPSGSAPSQEPADAYGANRAKHSSPNQPSFRVRAITAACVPPAYAKPRTALVSRHRLNVACRASGHSPMPTARTQPSAPARARSTAGNRAVEPGQPPGPDRGPGQHRYPLAGGQRLRGHALERVAAAPRPCPPRNRAGPSRFPGWRTATQPRWATRPGSGRGPPRPPRPRTSPSGAGRRSGSSRCPARCRAAARTAARGSWPAPAGRKPSG